MIMKSAFSFATASDFFTIVLTSGFCSAGLFSATNVASGTTSSNAVFISSPPAVSSALADLRERFFFSAGFASAAASLSFASALGFAAFFAVFGSSAATSTGCTSACSGCTSTGADASTGASMLLSSSVKSAKSDSSFATFICLSTFLAFI